MTDTAGTYAYAIDFSRDGGATFDLSDLVHWGVDIAYDPATLIARIAKGHNLSDPTAMMAPRMWRVRAWRYNGDTTPTRTEIDQLAGTAAAATWTTPAIPDDDGHIHQPEYRTITASVARPDGSHIASTTCLACLQPIHAVNPFGITRLATLAWKLTTKTLPDPEPDVTTALSDELVTGTYNGWQIRNRADAGWITVVSARTVDRSWMPFRASGNAIEVTTPDRVGHVDPVYAIQVRPVPTIAR